MKEPPFPVTLGMVAASALAATSIVIIDACFSVGSDLDSVGCFSVGSDLDIATKNLLRTGLRHRAVKRTSTTAALRLRNSKNGCAK